MTVNLNKHIKSESKAADKLLQIYVSKVYPKSDFYLNDI